MMRVHATSIAVADAGVLLRGPSGSGKSDLAVRLIDAGARLVADDQTELRRDGGSLRMSAPAALRGLIEVRGLGIVRVEAIASVPLRLVVDLVSEEAIERLPEPSFVTLAGLSFPRLALAPFAASAGAKLRLAVMALAQPAMIGALGAS
jgi:serine kinase of HPr protein (carbohydrate metabolism regulator)